MPFLLLFVQQFQGPLNQALASASVENRRDVAVLVDRLACIRKIAPPPNTAVRVTFA